MSEPGCDRSLQVGRWLVLSLGVVATVLVVALAGVGAFSLLEEPPVVYTNLPFPTAEIVIAGEPIRPTVSRCNNLGRDVLVATTRRLREVDRGTTANTPPGSALVSPGCTTAIGDVMVPLGTPPGRYQVDYIANMAGRWRSFAVPVQTQIFTVVAD